MNINRMNVIKRNGKIQKVSFDKITKRITEQCNNLSIDSIEIAMKVINEIKNNIKTTELDEHTAIICSSLITTDLEYGILANRIIISNNHKNTLNDFTDKIQLLYNYTDIHNKHSPIVTKELYDYVNLHKEKISEKIKYERDYDFDYFSFKTLEKSYLFKIDNAIIERIQDMFMRVSLSIHIDNIDNALECYEYISQKYFIHATPTLFNAGTSSPQLLSCFLLGLDDSIDSLFKVVSDCAKISKNSGGIGIDFDKIRSNDSHIRGTNGHSNGIIPFLKVFNETAKAVNQGGKRNGSIAVYLQPHHPDLLSFLNLRKNHGDEDERARDLFLALWVSDLFMKRVEQNGTWSFFNPDLCQDLSDSFGDEYEEKYLEYESKEMYCKQMSAREIWNAISVSQMETGTPYILYKDSINRKSNQSNIGVIKSSNLCAEIVEYSDSSEYACCTLASIGLPKLVSTNYDSTKFIVYSKHNCKNCKKLKNFFNKHNIKFQEVILDNKKDRVSLYQKIDEKYDIVINEMPIVFEQNVSNSGNVSNSVDEIDIMNRNIDTNSIDLDNYELLGNYNDVKSNIKISYNFEKLKNISGMLVKNLNNIIDFNYYPVPETEISNRKHRPIGIGVQGLADVFIKMGYSFDSLEAKDLNKQIFEAIYYGALESSMMLAKAREIDMKALQLLENRLKFIEHEFDMKSMDDLLKAVVDIEYETAKFTKKLNPIRGELDRTEFLGTYSSYIGSPIYNGKLQCDLWENDVSNDLFDWTNLRGEIKKYGVRNSLLVALMPTASTSQILGNNECFEPYTNNIYNRRTMAGDFRIINKHLVYDLIELDLWNEDMKDLIIYHSGSVQNISIIPDHIKKLYKTVWEIEPKVLIDLSVDRGPFVDQTQSLNLFFYEPTSKDLTKALFYGWKKGLKTGSYYIRTQSKVSAQQMTINPDDIKKIEEGFEQKMKDTNGKVNTSNNGTKDELVETKYEVCEGCSG